MIQSHSAWCEGKPLNGFDEDNIIHSRCYACSKRKWIKTLKREQDFILFKVLKIYLGLIKEKSFKDNSSIKVIKPHTHEEHFDQASFSSQPFARLLIHFLGISNSLLD